MWCLTSRPLMASQQQQQRQQQQQQQRQPMWLGATATGPLPSRAIPGTPGGVPVQGNGFLCQPQTALAHQQQHQQQQQQSIAGFTTVETTSATMPNPIFALSSQGSDHCLGPFSGPNGAHAGMRLGSIFATPPNAVANGSQSGAVGSGALVVRPQQSSVFSTPVTGSSVFAPAGIGGTGVHPAAAAATAIAKAAAARGIDGNAAGIPFPRHSFLQLNPVRQQNAWKWKVYRSSAAEFAFSADFSCTSGVWSGEGAFPRSGAFLTDVARRRRLHGR